MTTETNNPIFSYPDTKASSADIASNLCDFSLFLTVMKHREAYQNTLSLILEEPDIQIREVKVEQVVLNTIINAFTDMPYRYANIEQTQKGSKTA